jgi:hypothetical protein
MHDGKTVTFAPHFLKIGKSDTVQVCTVPPPAFAAAFWPLSRSGFFALERPLSAAEQSRPEAAKSIDLDTALRSGRG